MIDNIDHIGIAVSNLNEAIKIYRDALGLDVRDIEEIKEQKVRVASIPIGGSKIELLESTSPEGTIAKFISKNGEGIHHIALKVLNIDSVLIKIKSQGVTLIDEKPRIGAGGAKIAFIHPKSTRGVLLELCEKR